MKIVIAILIFSILILFHELGHFLFAKRNGIIVDEFALGMGPVLASIERGGTNYCIKLLPFGGSCMMRGESDEEEGEGTFNNASVLARISVVAGGPLFNFILAFLAGLVIVSLMGFDPAQVTNVAKDSPAAKAGLEEGDVVTSINGRGIDVGRDLYSYEMLTGLPKDQVELKVKRNGETKSISFQPKTETRYMLGISYQENTSKAEISVSLGLPMQKAGLKGGEIITAVNGVKISSGKELKEYFTQHPLDGKDVTITYLSEGHEKEVILKPVSNTIVDSGFQYNLARVKTGPLGVIRYGAVEVKYWIRTTITSLHMLVTGKVSVNEMSGPVGVVNVIGDTYEESRSEGFKILFVSMLNMIVLLSANLGIMNLLPLPALDGGRLVFLLLEAVRRKPLNRRIEGMIHAGGLGILLLLMIYITIRDIMHLF